MNASAVQPTPPPVLRPAGIFNWRGWLGILTLVPLALASILSGRHWTEGTWFDENLDAVGYVLILAGVGLRTWATLYVGGRKSRELVTAGPYSLCRNPLYLGSLLVGIAIAFLLQSLSFGVMLLLIVPIYYLPVIREEERILAANHPEAFARYRQEVPRLIPRRLRPTRTEKELSINMRALRAHVMRSLLTLALIPLNEWIATLQFQGRVPTWFHLP